MRQQIEERLGELARRAGLGGVEPRVLAAVAVLAVLAMGWAAWRWVPTPGAVEVAARDELASGEQAVEGDSVFGAASTTESVSPPTVFVHVAGAVRRPGVVELAGGSRVVDAVEAAGGALPDAVLDGVNLARPVTDGEQILVPDEDAVQAAGGSPGAAAGASGVGGGVAASAGGAGSGDPLVVNVNAADQATLETLPGVGPATALKIIAERESNGPFETVEDLRRVPGIGEKKLEAMRESVSVR